MKCYSFNPGDKIRWFGQIWNVTGVFIGALKQQNIVGLECDYVCSVPNAYGKPVMEMFVPEEILVAAISDIKMQWLRPTKPEESAMPGKYDEQPPQTPIL